MDTITFTYRVLTQDGTHARIEVSSDRPVNGLHQFEMPFVDVPSDADAFFVQRVRDRVFQDAGGIKIEVVKAA